MSRNKKTRNNSRLFAFFSVIMLFVVFQNCSPSNINEQFQTAVNKSNSSSNQIGGQQQDQASDLTNYAQKNSYSIVKSGLKVSEVSISDIYLAQIEFDKDYNSPMISIVNQSSATSCPSSSGSYMSLLDIENSNFVGRNGAYYGWKHADASNVFRDMFLSSSASNINIMVCFLSEKNNIPSVIGQFSIKLKNVTSIAAGTDSTTGSLAVKCPTTSSVVDNWPFNTGGATWIRSFEVPGLSMRFTYEQLKQITSELSFRMSGDGGGYGGNISLCPGDMNGGFPAATYVSAPPAGKKIGDPCVSSTNQIYMTEGAVRAHQQRVQAGTDKDYIPVCLLKKSDAYYINYRPLASANSSSKAQFWIIAGF